MADTERVAEAISVFVSDQVAVSDRNEAVGSPVADDVSSTVVDADRLTDGVGGIASDFVTVSLGLSAAVGETRCDRDIPNVFDVLGLSVSVNVGGAAEKVLLKDKTSESDCGPTVIDAVRNSVSDSDPALEKEFVAVRGTSWLAEGTREDDLDFDFGELSVGERTGAGVIVIITVSDTVDRDKVLSSLREFLDGTTEDEFRRTVFVLKCVAVNRSVGVRTVRDGLLSTDAEIVSERVAINDSLDLSVAERDASRVFVSVWGLVGDTDEDVLPPEKVADTT